jgi:hypothetical protein
MYFEIIDNSIPADFRQQVWDYLSEQVWQVWSRYDKKLHLYTPSKDGWDFPEKLENAKDGVMLSRATLSVDKWHLKHHHNLIFQLWEKINHQLGDKWEIAGTLEGCSGDTVPELAPPRSLIDDDKLGWRVYTNGTSSDRIKRNHGIHRDTIDMNDDETATILYVANMEWYPTWMAEIVFYDEDPEGVTGDHQQWQNSKGGYAQRREFQVGWPSKLGAAVPGRIMAYDGRTLHTTRPTSEWAPTQRVTLAFRARLKK